MATKQYTTDMLQAGDVFVVKGKTSYPRLTRVVDGDELREEIQRATQQGRIPESKPFSGTTLVDAEIKFANPQAPTMAELYAQERLYMNKDNRVCYNAIRRSPTLAEYGVVDATDYTQIQGMYLDPEKNVANDLMVECYFRVYDTKAGMHKGVSLDTVVFLEPVRYYEASNAMNQLASRGLTWNAPEGPAPVYNPQTTVPAYNQPMPQAQPAYNQAPLPQAQPAYNQQAPMQNGTPVQQPAYNNQPMPVPNAAPQPAYNQAPIPQAQQPVYGQQNQAPMPQSQVDPYAGNAPIPQPQPQPQQTIGNANGSAFDGAGAYNM